MNLNEAYALLTPPLTFGSDMQIAAVRLVERYELVRDSGEGDKCTLCEGEGETKCGECGQEVTCPDCGGCGFDLRCDPRDMYIKRLMDEKQLWLPGALNA